MYYKIFKINQNKLLEQFSIKTATYHTVTKSLVKGSHFKEHLLIDLGLCSGVTRVKFGLLFATVLGDQVEGGRAALGHHEVAVDQGGDCVLGIHLQMNVYPIVITIIE